MNLKGTPLIVAGMHRSGTSLTASLIEAAGVDMGEALLAPDRANPLGYFEDEWFVGFHGRLLAAATPEGDGGHRDWGWTESERLDRERFAGFREEARAMAATRARAGRPWGWKDPRTTLTLDFWDEVLEGEARFLFVYRHPWDVADSMQRLGAEVFLRNPGYAWRIWSFYNRHLLDFRRRRRDRSLLVSANALVHDPEELRPLLAARFGLDLPEERLRGILDGRRLRATEGADPLAGLAAAVWPEAVRLLRELDAEADLPGSRLWEAHPVTEHRALSIPGSAPVRLSVVIPCFDDGEFLVEAVASAERSVAEPYELIVVNDGSRQPRTLEILDVLRAAGYPVVDQENAGVAAVRNRGIALASGRYILPLDADNRLLPGFPEAAMRVLDEDPGVGVVYGDRRDFGLRSGTVEVPELNLDRLLRGNYIDACAVLRKSAWADCGGFDETMPHPGWEDWEIWISMTERGWRFHRLPGATFEYRVRPDSMVWHCARPEVGGALQAYIVTKHRDLYLRHLPEMLLAAQEAERLSGEMRGEVERLREELERIAAERDTAVRDREAVSSRVQELELAHHGLERAYGSLESGHRALESGYRALEVRCDALETERDRLYEELAEWRERVGFMEETTAWRLRERLVQLRRVWRGRRPS